MISACYEFKLSSESKTRGYILQWVVEKMPWTADWSIDHQKREVKLLLANADPDQQNRSIAETLDEARKKGTFEILNGWRDELYPINAASEFQVSMERAASALFGIVTYGVHMTAYVRVQGLIKIWVPRRARKKQTYGGMLDNTVAGGISTGETPLECLVREAAEEASFPEQLVRSNAKACGAVSYFYIRDERAGGEPGLLQPEVQLVYDMEVDKDIVPKPGDDEVEDFFLWTVEEVQQALAQGQFKPNCALVLIDFLVRHGILSVENERNLIEISSRTHRKIPFPVTIA